MIKLICGRSRAGKTTYSQQFDSVIHLDDYGSDCYERVAKVVAQAQGDVVVDGVYNTSERRKTLLNAYLGEGEKTCIWLDTPHEVIESRFFWRWKPIDMPQLFEPPTLDEGWDEIVIIRGNDHVESYSNERKA